MMTDSDLVTLIAIMCLILSGGAIPFLFASTGSTATKRVRSMAFVPVLILFLGSLGLIEFNVRNALENAKQRQFSSTASTDEEVELRKHADTGSPSKPHNEEAEDATKTPKPEETEDGDGNNDAVRFLLFRGGGGFHTGFRR